MAVRLCQPPASPDSVQLPTQPIIVERPPQTCILNRYPAVLPTRGTTARENYRDLILNCRPLSPIRHLQLSRTQFMPKSGVAVSYDTPEILALHDIDAASVINNIAEGPSKIKEFTEKSHKSQNKGYKHYIALHIRTHTALRFRCAVRDTASCRHALCQYMASYLPLCRMYLKAESSHAFPFQFQFSSR